MMRSIKRFLKNVAFACRAVYYVMLKPKTNIIAICTHEDKDGPVGINVSVSIRFGGEGLTNAVDCDELAEELSETISSHITRKLNDAIGDVIPGRPSTTPAVEPEDAPTVEQPID